MVPVRKFGESQIVTQYSMEPVEKLGLVKMDFLGLRTLSVIEGALENIKANGKGEIDLDEIPMDDQKTYEMLQRGDTLGVFQLESSGMTALVVRMKPDCFEDLIALVALYRPGPLESGMATVCTVQAQGRAGPLPPSRPCRIYEGDLRSHPVPEHRSCRSHLRWRDTLLERQTCCEGPWKEKSGGNGGTA
jgi:hypothetical protein